MWTMDELVERVREALAAEYAGAPNGRVRDLPDRRAIRWYTTIGLVDRPLGMRGRTALYGPRHLLQLVALKRRQAEGRTLAEIQTELAGASDEELAAVARVPQALLVPDGPPPDQQDPSERTRFWAASPLRPDIAVVTDTPPLRRARSGFGTASPEPHRKSRSAGARPPVAATPIGGVVLRGGAILVLSSTPTPEDRVAIAAAAEPLLAVLDARGLLERPVSPNSALPHDGRTS